MKVLRGVFNPERTGHAGSVSVEEFSALAWLLAAAPPQVHLKQLSILQLAFGAAAALRGRKHAAWEALAKAERELISLSANGERYMHSLVDCIDAVSSQTGDRKIVADVNTNLSSVRHLNCDIWQVW